MKKLLVIVFVLAVSSTLIGATFIDNFLDFIGVSTPEVTPTVTLTNVSIPISTPTPEFYTVIFEISHTNKTARRCLPDMDDSIANYSIAGIYFTYSDDKKKAYAHLTVRGKDYVEFEKKIKSDKTKYKLSSAYPLPTPTPTRISR